MKKIVFWGVFIHVFILIALVSCASMKREPISEGNLSDLRGKWEGWRSISGRDLRTEMEIYNDTLPLKGKFIFHDVKRKDKIGGTFTSEFKQGMIKDNKFYLKQGQDYFELSLHKGDGKLKLKGNFSSSVHNGTLTLSKK
jgi:hypothetical protein